MIPELREAFNSTFTEKRYQDFLQRLDYRCRTDISFRVSETPFFVPKAIQTACEQAAIDLTLQAHNPAYLQRSNETLKPEYTVAGQPERSTFMAVDFAMTLAPDGSIVPKLIELQGFPSLMGYQLYLAELLQEHFALPPELQYINGGHSRSEFFDILHKAIVADENPENVVLLELDPWNQKTVPDFRAIHEMLGIGIADIRHVEKEGKKLYYRDNGKRIPINRIFNRAIVDEIDRKGEKLPFNWNDELDVAWAGHPNWYFRISKFTLPFLDHPLVPKAWFLNDLETFPEDLNDYVLKPLYSFAGTGVVVGPTREDIAAITTERLGDYLLQEKIEYAGVINTPDGATKAEMRVMLVWLPDEVTPRPLMGLVRTGRGKMMGVDHNKGMRWIGASCNFFEP